MFYGFLSALGIAIWNIFPCYQSSTVEACACGICLSSSTDEALNDHASAQLVIRINLGARRAVPASFAAVGLPVISGYPTRVYWTGTGRDSYALPYVYNLVSIILHFLSL